MSEPSLAALAYAVARTPRAALLCSLDPTSGALTPTLCRLGPDRLWATDDTTALDQFADALTPTATLPFDEVAGLGFVTYDAARRASTPKPFTDARPVGDPCPAAWMAPVVARARPPFTATDFADLLARAVDPPSVTAPPWSTLDRDDHRAAVESVRASIRDGDVYLVNVTRVLHAPPTLTDAQRAAYLATRFANAAPARGMLLNLGPLRIAAMTMELALRWERHHHRAVTAPIKGTRPRHLHDATADRAAAEALAHDPKERAENAMAVDVHRNDLGRVATAGGVRVTSLCHTEAHRFVHHLVSTIEADLAPDTTARDLLRSMLPVGSVTGAPKLAAMETIAQVEPTRRGLYTGIVATVRGDGGLEGSVAIRTLVDDASGLHYGVGGGIVWDSDAAQEWDELSWKLRALTP